MSKKLNRLSARFVTNVRKKGTYADGGGLFLQVGIAGQAKSWIFMYRRGRLTGDYKSKRGYVGLGSADAVSLAAARAAGQKCREWLTAGRDPRNEHLREKREAATLLTTTFLDWANDWMAVRGNDAEKPWRQNTRQGHEQRLNDYLKPLHSMPITEITANHVYEIIHPLRQDGRKDTAHKVRVLIETVIEWARARNAFPLDKINPASMKGLLATLLHTTNDQPISTPLPCVHYTKLPALYAKISALTSRSVLTMSEAARISRKDRAYLYNMIRCGRLQATKPDPKYLEFPYSLDDWLVDPAELIKVAAREGWTLGDMTPGLPPVQVYILLYQILCACRPGEARGMRWSEWDEIDQFWDVPWQRLKTGWRTRLDHHIPLSEPAIAILKTMREKQKQDKIEDTEFVFANYRGSNPRSARLRIPPCHNTVRNLLKSNLSDADADKTLHGMRTTFGSWARQLGYVEPDIERALAHIKGYGNVHVARLYTRDATRDVPLRLLFEAWAKYCLRRELPADVIPIRRNPPSLTKEAM